MKLCNLGLQNPNGIELNLELCCFSENVGWECWNGIAKRIVEGHMKNHETFIKELISIPLFVLKKKTFKSKGRRFSGIESIIEFFL